MNQRATTTLSLAVAFGVMTGSGVLLFWQPHSTTVAAVHTMFAAVALLGIGLHVRNNVRALVKHGRGLGAVAVAVSAIVLGGTTSGVPGFRRLYDWGNERRNQQMHVREEFERYEFITTARGGTHLEIDIKRGRAFQYSLFAVWIEVAGKRETLYVSRSVPQRTSRARRSIGRSPCRCGCTAASPTSTRSARRLRTPPGT
ncbi:MAG: hypothetical protein IPH44_24155 [Myxococcales bacterium]|nr:hypothetical protein [Myxococcales bacterium]MBK7193314.1 hypothetical protein [Myxococcales bacterium]MBP7550715.1 hypothetical protein [Gemmatimonadaceae bacterium]